MKPPEIYQVHNVIIHKLEVKINCSDAMLSPQGEAEISGTAARALLSDISKFISLDSCESNDNLETERTYSLFLVHPAHINPSKEEVSNLTERFYCQGYKTGVEFGKSARRLKNVLDKPEDEE